MLSRIESIIATHEDFYKSDLPKIDDSVLWDAIIRMTNERPNTRYISHYIVDFYHTSTSESALDAREHGVSLSNVTRCLVVVIDC